MDYVLIEKVVPLYAGIRRRDREAYIAHVLRVADRLQTVGASKEVQLVALLHDALELSNMATMESLTKTFKLSEKVITALGILTRNQGENSKEHFNRVLNSENVYALLVKYFDCTDNAIFTEADKVWTQIELGLDAKLEEAKYMDRSGLVYAKLKEFGIDLYDY